MDILFTAINAALFIGCLLALTRCNRDAKHLERRRKAFDEGMARLHSLKTELAALADAHAALGTQLAKLRGKFYASQSKREPVTLEGEYEDRTADAAPASAPYDLDPEFLAAIQLQTAPPKAPGT